MKSVTEMIGFLKRSLSEKNARRNPTRSARSLNQVEAVEQRLLLAADLNEALFNSAVLQDFGRDDLLQSYFVRFETAQNASQLAQATGAASVEPSEFVTNGYTLEFDQGITVQAAADAFSELPGFDYLHPNIEIQYSPFLLPNDTLFGDQWHLRNTGQGGGVAGIDANIETVWDNFTGEGVTIAIVDDGVETAHEDFVGSINTDLDFDWNGDDDDPNPVAASDNHGTAVAGVAAARGNNNLGVTGSAFEAEIVGLRLIAGPISDRDIAEALTHRSDVIDIYNNSWGPGNIGRVNFIGPQTQAALRDSAINGRDGLGTIQVFAAGNSGLGSNVNYNPLTNSRYTVTVAALANNGTRAGYSTPGAAVVVTAPSNGGSLGITTTDRTGDVGYSNTNYANDFGGTSSAAPLVSGIIALMLEANPNLTYRDVNDILAHTSERVDVNNPDWTQNGAGLWVNHEYGFGAIDATAAVDAALNHIPLPPEETFSTAIQGVNQVIPDNGAAVIGTVNVAAADAIDSLEYVEVVLNANHSFIGDLEVILTSPSGTRSVLAETRATDPGTAYANYVFSTVRHWDESSEGTWSLSLQDGTANNVGTFNSFQLRFFGTGVSSAPIIIQTAGNTTVSDAGQTDTFGVVLPVQPVSNVVLDVVSADTTEVEVSTSRLTFTPANWNVPQNVTVSGVPDLIADGDQITNVTVSVVAALSDPTFAEADSAVVAVTSIDDDEFFPGKPVLTSPIGITDTTTPLFQWTRGQNTLSFNLTVTNVVTGTVVTQASGLLGTSHTFPDTFADGVYSTVVEAVNPIGQSNPSEPVLFAVGVPEIPVAPVIAAPTIGQVVLTSTPQIRWLPVNAAFQYEVQVLSGETRLQEVVDGIDAGNGTLGHTFAQGLSEGPATVWVRGINALGQPGPWSEPVDFIVDAIPRPARPVIFEPSLAVTPNAFPTFRWVAPGGNTYQLWVGRVPEAGGAGTASTVNNRVINLTGHTTTDYQHFIALRNGQYVAWVRSFNSVGEPSEWSESISFRVDVPVPATPAIVSYTPSAARMPTLEWDTSGADFPPGTTYHLWVNNLSTGQSRIVQETRLTSKTFTFPEALPQGRYGAWVQARSAVGDISAWSNRFDFEIDIAAPGRSTLTGPVTEDGSTVVLSEFPTFEWTAGEGAATYDLWVNHTESQTTQIIREVGIETTSFTSELALPEGHFRAWVRGLNSAGEVGEWSAVHEFQIDVPGPATPTVTGPAPNAVGTVDSASPTISWIALGGASTYNLQLQSLPSNASILNLQGIEESSYAVTETLNEQSYRVRVQSVNSVGEVSNWSEWYTFRIDVPNATTPVALLPEGTVTQPTVTFQWEHSRDSVRYELLVRDLLQQESIVFQVTTFQLDTTLDRAIFSTDLEDGTYRFWVRAFNSQGTASAWSNSKSFVVDAVASTEDETGPEELQIVLASLPQQHSVRNSEPVPVTAQSPAADHRVIPADSDARGTVVDAQEQAQDSEPTVAVNPRTEQQQNSEVLDLAQVMAEFADPLVQAWPEQHQS